MANKKIPKEFKKKTVSFSIKPSVILEFKAQCFKAGKKPSNVVEDMLMAFVSVDVSFNPKDK